MSSGLRMSFAPERLNGHQRTAGALYWVNSEESGAEAQELCGDVARRALARRKLRLRCFTAELAHDAAWNMLLELLIARSEARAVPIKCLWSVSGVSVSTALRTVRQLESLGHVIRKNDAEDRRRQLIEIAPALAARIREFLRETEAV